MARRKSKRKGGPGRPCDLTPEKVKRYCEALRAGHWRSVAARLAGVHPATARRWRQQGRQEAAGEFHDFEAAAVAAEAENEDRDVRALANLAELGDVKAITWRLSHRYPTRWSEPRQRIEHSGPDGGPIQQEIAELSDEQLAKLLLLAKPIGE